MTQLLVVQDWEKRTREYVGQNTSIAFTNGIGECFNGSKKRERTIWPMNSSKAKHIALWSGFRGVRQQMDDVQINGLQHPS